MALTNTSSSNTDFFDGVVILNSLKRRLVLYWVKCDVQSRFAVIFNIYAIDLLEAIKL